MSVIAGRKRKTFPALDAPAPKLYAIRPAANPENEGSENDSDAPEAVTLTSGRAAADAKNSAIQDHRKRLLEKKKTQNKIRDAFIQSTKSKSPSAAPAIQKSPTPVDDGSSDNENNLNENDEDSTAIEGDPALLARMEKAMQDALDEGEEEDESDDEGLDGCQPTPPSSSSRLPDFIFAAAAVEERKLERKRTKTAQSREANPKRRRWEDFASSESA